VSNPSCGVTIALYDNPKFLSPSVGNVSVDHIFIFSSKTFFHEKGRGGQACASRQSSDPVNNV
jgi:hypothetical protein